MAEGGHVCSRYQWQRVTARWHLSLRGGAYRPGGRRASRRARRAVRRRRRIARARTHVRLRATGCFSIIATPRLNSDSDSRIVHSLSLSLCSRLSTHLLYSFRLLLHRWPHAYFGSISKKTREKSIIRSTYRNYSAFNQIIMSLDLQYKRLAAKY